MKTILEFGVRKGFHVENLILPSVKAGAAMAANIVAMLENDPYAPKARPGQWLAGEARTTWQSNTHFVALTKMDGRLRGCASAGLWRREDTPPRFGRGEDPAIEKQASDAAFGTHGQG